MKCSVLYVIFLLVFPVAFIGCNRQSNFGESVQDNTISVISTIFAPYDFVREIAGENADITMLIPPASESHSFEPTPKDILKIQNSDIFIYVGGESDAWVNEILTSINTEKIEIIRLMDCIALLEDEIVEGMELEDGHSEDVDYDEHVWTSPKNAKLIVQKISDTICELDSENLSVYRQNTDAYLARLDELDKAFRDVVNEASRKTIIFGDRFPFRYFVDTYELDYFAAFPGCSSETEPSAATVVFLINKIKEENIPVIFHAELSNAKMANTISEATGAKVLLLHACHNISRDDFLNGVSYLDLMESNVNALKEAIK